MAKSWGVQGIPAVFLIGPDGKVLQIGLRGEAIQAAVTRAMERRWRTDPMRSNSRLWPSLVGQTFLSVVESAGGGILATQADSNPFGMDKNVPPLTYSTADKNVCPTKTLG